MRKVNQITWDLFKSEWKHLDYKSFKKGEKLNIINSGALGITKDGFWYEESPKFFSIKVR